MPGQYRKLGISSAGILLLGWSISLYFHVPGPGAFICFSSAVNGVVFAVLLALVTRTRHPVLIYIFFGLALVSLAPLIAGQPANDLLSPFMTESAANYLDVIRLTAFLLAIPYPYAILGQHAPDPLPEEKDRSLADAGDVIMKTEAIEKSDQTEKQM